MKAIAQLPTRIAAKLTGISCTKTLAVIRANRLARKTTDYSAHIRRHHIFLACIDQAVAIRKERNASL
jgi:hypothetical protein